MPKTAKEMERIIRKDGWYLVEQTGSHRQYIHPVKKGRVTIPWHQGKTLSIAVEHSILRQAGLKKKK